MMLSKYLTCFREFKKHVTNLLYLLIVIITKINDMKYTANKSSQGRMLGVKQVLLDLNNLYVNLYLKEHNLLPMNLGMRMEMTQIGCQQTFMSIGL